MAFCRHIESIENQAVKVAMLHFHGPDPDAGREGDTAGYDEEVEYFVVTEDTWQGIGPVAGVDDCSDGVENSSRYHRQYK